MQSGSPPPYEGGGRGEVPLDLAALRARLAGARGPQFWRCLEELAGTEAFQAFLRRELPRQAAAWEPALDRRGFLTLLGASLALAGLSGCTIKQPKERIVPYIDQPDNLVPGKPLSFATAIPLGGYAQGALVTSREGRPIKVEGNPDHPASLGHTDAFMQAALLELYDPDRSQAVIHLGRPNSWDNFVAVLTQQLEAQRASGGAGLRLLTGAVTSPTLTSQIQALLARFPAARWHAHEPIGQENAQAGARMAFGTDANTLYHFDKADVVLSLDGDFLLTLPGHVRYAADFADKRRVRKEKPGMCRLYAAESAPTITGAMADHRLHLRAGEIETVTRAIAQQMGVEIGSAPVPLPAAAPAAWIQAVARDLQTHRGASIVVPGAHQPPVVHALAHAMNAQLGNVGKTVHYTEPVEANVTARAGTLQELTAALQAGRVQMLVLLDCNPVYTAPADLNFADALPKAPFSVHLGLYDDETAALCQWHLPQTHTLEAWSDARAYDGTISIIQPLIAPLYDTKSAHELLAAMLLQPNPADHDIVRGYWQKRSGASDFETFWRTALHDGLIHDSAKTPPQPSPSQGEGALSSPLSLRRRGAGGEVAPLSLRRRGAGGEVAPPPYEGGGRGEVPNASSGLELIFQPDPTLWDGRFANNGWMQELPKPLSKLTWDNAALVSPRTAETHGLANEDVVELRYRGRTQRAAVWILPGHPDAAVTLTLGYGRMRAGKIGTGTGFNAYALRTSDAPWFGNGLEIRKTGEKYPLACTHSHHTMEGRDIVRAGTIAQFRENPDFVRKGHPPERPPSLLPDWQYNGYAWGMSIDTNVCIGCNACVVACQAENNISVVGKAEVLRGREMHWLRIDRYYAGNDLDRPTATYFMPIPCMHCEQAPCELVCPVGATVHDRDGLNDMVYNRCVGTRYCSNNCPYKVRRFNFFHYADGKPETAPGNYSAPTLRLMANPEVTIRSRGVMEKCTYCIQRIQNAKIQAEEENRTVRDGEIRTACQQACPTRAIVFGNINDKHSEVAQTKAEPHEYGLMTELGTRPRTTYLARLSNPNPEMESA